MSKARLVLIAVTLENRSVREVAQTYGVSRSWIYELLARYRTEGETAFTPRAKTPHTTPSATPPETIALITKLRSDLTTAGLDAGPDTIAWHLRHHHNITVSRATIYRTLKRGELIKPEPTKKPKSAYIRFQAAQPNETWQADFTHHRLANGTDIEILTWLDDHSRYALSVTAHKPVTGSIVAETFRAAIKQHGIPGSTLTDNGLVFTTRYAGKKSGRNAFETELTKHHIQQKNSRPNHPTTCGKVERFQQTMKNWLRAQPTATTIHQLQQQLDTFTHTYNTQRPHRSLPHQTTPLVAYTTRPKTTPTNTPKDTTRIRHDRVGTTGKITLRHNGHLYKIGIGRPHTGTPIITLIHNLNIRIIHAHTGELLRTLTLDTTRTYQPTGKPKGGPKRPYGPQNK